MPLRLRQIEALEKSYERWIHGVNKQLVQLPTGLGKTVVAASMAEHHGITGRILFLLHREELAEQTIRAFRKWNPSYTVGLEMGSSRSDINDRVVVASVPTIGREGSRRIENICGTADVPFEFVCCDEAHHSVATTYKNVFRRLGLLTEPGTNGQRRLENGARPDGRRFPLLVGITATPQRGDGKAMAEVYDEVVFQYPMRRAIEEGWLAELRGFKVKTSTTLDAVRMTAGDFNSSDLTLAVNTRQRNALVVRAWVDHAYPRQTIGFSVDVQHAKDLAAEFQRNSIPAEAIWADDERRADKLARHKRGELKVLFNCGILCLDAATEILTSSGWVGKDEMTPSHLVANWNQGEVYFDKPLDIYHRKRAVSEGMVELNTCRRSVRVTEGHNMLYRTFDKGHFLKDKAANLVGRQLSIPVSGNALPFDVVPLQPTELTASRRKRLISAGSYNLRKLEGFGQKDSVKEMTRRVDRKYGLRYKAPHEMTTHECALVGFWIGDGGRNELQKGGIEYILAQSSVYPDIIKKLTFTLKQTGIHYVRKNIPARPGVNAFVKWSLPRGTGGGSQQREGVFSLEPYLNKSGSELFWGWNEEQFTAFLHGLWYADGNHGKGDVPLSFRIDAVNKTLLDLLQAIAVCRGFRATIQKGCKPRKANHSQIYRLSFRKTDSHIVVNNKLCNSFQRDTEWKDEDVWCVKTSSGNIVTRRRGTVTVMGNCEGYDDPGVQCIIMARPTSSQLLFVQMIGRGTRIPEGVDNLIDARRAGQKLAKSDCVVLDVVDCTRRNSLVTLSSIFGMNVEMDLQGQSAVKAVAKIEQMAEKNPNVDFSKVININDLDSVVEHVDLFEYKVPNEIRSFSLLSWHTALDGSYTVNLLNNEKISITTDLLGKMTVRGTVQGVRFVEHGFDDLQQAVQFAEMKISTHGKAYIDAMKQQAAKWDSFVHRKKGGTSEEVVKNVYGADHDEPAASPAIAFLVRAFDNKPLPPNLTKGQAKHLISQYISGTMRS